MKLTAPPTKRWQYSFLRFICFYFLSHTPVELLDILWFSLVCSEIARCARREFEKWNTVSLVPKRPSSHKNYPVNRYDFSHMLVCLLVTPAHWKCCRAPRFSLLSTTSSGARKLVRGQLWRATGRRQSTTSHSVHPQVTCTTCVLKVSSFVRAGMAARNITANLM